MALTLSVDDLQALARMSRRGLHGSVYFVVSVGGDDLDDGLSPNTALATIEEALDRSTAGDLILLGPGTYPQGAAALQGKEGVTIEGCGPSTVITGNTTSDAILRTRSRMTLRDLTIQSVGNDSAGPPIGAFAAQNHEQLDIALERVTLIGTSDAAVYQCASANANIRISARDCVIVSAFDGFTVQGVDGRADLLFTNSMFVCRKSSAINGCLYLSIAGATRTAYINCTAVGCSMHTIHESSTGDAFVVRATSVNTTPFDTFRSETRINLIGCALSLDTPDAGDRIFSIDGPRTVVRVSNTSYDKSVEATLVNGGPAPVESTSRADVRSVAGGSVSGVADFRANVAGLAQSSQIPANFSTVTIANSAMAANITRVAGAGVAGISDFTNSASNIRAALGMAAANLDSALAALDAQVLTRLAAAAYTAPDNAGIAEVRTKTDQLSFTDNAVAANITRVAGAGVAGISEFTNSASSIRAALGMGSANLDSALAELGAQVLTRLAAAAYTAPDNAGVADIKQKTDQLTFDGAAVVSTGGAGIEPEDLEPILDAIDEIKGAGFVAESDNLRAIRLAAAGGGVTPAPGAVAVPVTITARDTGAPVGGARVWITSTEHPAASVVLSNAFTNGAGEVRVVNGTPQGGPLMLLEGAYWVWANKPGVNLDSPQLIEVEAAEEDEA